MQTDEKNIDEIEFVAECEETKERVAFTMADLYGWDDETVFLDTSIYLNCPRKVNWAIICKDKYSRRVNPKYNIHLRTEEDRVLIEPLKLISVKLYSGYRFMAEFNNRVIRTGSLLRDISAEEKLPFYEDEFELARMSPRGLRVKEGIFISAMTLWRASEEYVHYGCNTMNFSWDKIKKIENVPLMTKPFGGFWASPSRTGKRFPFGWEDFCRREDYHPKSDLSQKLFFCLDMDANIFRIESMSDFEALPKIPNAGDVPAGTAELIDFEECLRQGIDAIEYAYTEVHRDEELGDEMDIKMQGWDCDSILILNTNIMLRESFFTERTKTYLTKE